MDEREQAQPQDEQTAALLEELEQRLKQGELQHEPFLREEAAHRHQQAIIYGGSLILLGSGAALYGIITQTRWAWVSGAWALGCGLLWGLWMSRCPRCKRYPMRLGTLAHMRSLSWPKGCPHCGLPFSAPER